MATFLRPFEGPIYAGLRVFAGLLFVQHGLQKVFGLIGEQPEPMSTELWIAGAIELLGGALVALGLFTRWAAFLASGLMAAAYFKAHFPQGFFPMLNRGELAVLYCWVFFFIAAHGPGNLSLDRALGRD